jgi:predicted AAA+ superfamily ATPase
MPAPCHFCAIHCTKHEKRNFGSILENVIYLDLLRRGNRVFVGKLGNAEIDFITETPAGTNEYYQVALTVRDAPTLQRELASLAAVHDHSPKTLLPLDFDPPATYNGIIQRNALEWLMEA